MIPAKGHTAKIFLFDDKTVMFPLSKSELSVLSNSINNRIALLSRCEGNDYPEHEHDMRLRDNVIAAIVLMNMNEVDKHAETKDQ